MWYLRELWLGEMKGISKLTCIRRRMTTRFRGTRKMFIIVARAKREIQKSGDKIRVAWNFTERSIH